MKPYILTNMMQRLYINECASTVDYYEERTEIIGQRFKEYRKNIYVERCSKIANHII